MMPYATHFEMPILLKQALDDLPRASHTSNKIKVLFVSNGFKQRLCLEDCNPIRKLLRSDIFLVVTPHPIAVLTREV
jgi:hypothetical protein